MSEMNSSEQTGDLDERELRELAAYADGSIDPARAAAIAERAAASPAHARALEGQLRALEAVQAARVDAPASLRSALERRRPAVARRPRLALPAGAALAFAALVATLAVALSGGSGGSHGPSVGAAVALASRGATLPAPATDPSNPAQLASAVDGVHYPYWDTVGWDPRGARADTIAGRHAETVYYADHAGRWIAYTIVAGAPLPVPGGAQAHTISGVELASFSAGSRTVVTWRRGGHTCVLSGVGVPARAMLVLAAAEGRGALAWHGVSTA